MRLNKDLVKTLGLAGHGDVVQKPVEMGGGRRGGNGSGRRKKEVSDH